MRAVDLEHPDWPSRACEALRSQAFVRLRLPSREMRLVRDLYQASSRAFSSRAARHQLRVPKCDFDELDGRNGYVGDRHREWLELHCSFPENYDSSITDGDALRLLNCATHFARYCRGVRMWM